MEIVEGFEEYLLLRDCRPITIKRHLRCLRFVASTLPEMTTKDCVEFLNNLKLSGTSNSSLNNIVSTLRLYASFLQVEIKLTLFKRSVQTVRRTLSDAEIEAFLSVECRRWMLPERHEMFTVFWALCAYCALRPGECARLKKEDIDLSNKQIVLRPEITKTNQFSTLPLFPNIFPLISKYIGSLETEYLFPSRHGGKYDNGQEEVVSQKDWSLDFTKRLEQACIKKVPGLVPYSLRHSCATRWIANDMSFYKVRRLMRHAKIEQTLVYEHMTSAHLVNSVIKYDPLVRKHSDPLDVLEGAQEQLDNYGLERDDRFSEEFKKKLKDLFYEEEKRLRNKNLAEPEA